MKCEKYSLWPPAVSPAPGVLLLGHRAGRIASALLCFLAGVSFCATPTSAPPVRLLNTHQCTNTVLIRRDSMSHLLNTSLLCFSSLHQALFLNQPLGLPRLLMTTSAAKPALSWPFSSTFGHSGWMKEGCPRQGHNVYSASEVLRQQ